MMDKSHDMSPTPAPRKSRLPLSYRDALSGPKRAPSATLMTPQASPARHMNSGGPQNSRFVSNGTNSSIAYVKDTAARRSPDQNSGKVSPHSVEENGSALEGPAVLEPTGTASANANVDDFANTTGQSNASTPSTVVSTTIKNAPKSEDAHHSLGSKKQNLISFGDETHTIKRSSSTHTVEYTDVTSADLAEAATKLAFLPYEPELTLGSLSRTSSNATTDTDRLKVILEDADPVYVIGVTRRIRRQAEEIRVLEKRNRVLESEVTNIKDYLKNREVETHTSEKDMTYASRSSNALRKSLATQAQSLPQKDDEIKLWRGKYQDALQDSKDSRQEHHSIRQQLEAQLQASTADLQKKDADIQRWMDKASEAQLLASFADSQKTDDETNIWKSKATDAEDQLKKLQDELANARASAGTISTTDIQQLEATIASRVEQVAKLQAKLDDGEKLIEENAAEAQKERVESNNKASSSHNFVDARDKEICDLNDTYDKLERANKHKAEELQRRNTVLERKNAELEAKDREITDLKRVKEQLQRHMDNILAISRQAASPPPPASTELVTARETSNTDGGSGHQPNSSSSGSPPPWGPPYDVASGSSGFVPSEHGGRTPMDTSSHALSTTPSVSQAQISSSSVDPVPSEHDNRKQTDASSPACSVAHRPSLLEARRSSRGQSRQDQGCRRGGSGASSGGRGGCPDQAQSSGRPATPRNPSLNHDIAAVDRAITTDNQKKRGELEKKLAHQGKSLDNAQAPMRDTYRVVDLDGDGKRRKNIVSTKVLAESTKMPVGEISKSSPVSIPGAIDNHARDSINGTTRGVAVSQAEAIPVQNAEAALAQAKPTPVQDVKGIPEKKKSGATSSQAEMTARERAMAKSQGKAEVNQHDAFDRSKDSPSTTDSKRTFTPSSSPESQYSQAQTDGGSDSRATTQPAQVNGPAASYSSVTAQKRPSDDVPVSVTTFATEQARDNGAASSRGMHKQAHRLRERNAGVAAGHEEKADAEQSSQQALSRDRHAAARTASGQVDARKDGARDNLTKIEAIKQQPCIAINKPDEANNMPEGSSETSRLKSVVANEDEQKFPQSAGDEPKSETDDIGWTVVPRKTRPEPKKKQSSSGEDRKVSGYTPARTSLPAPQGCQRLSSQNSAAVNNDAGASTSWAAVAKGRLANGGPSHQVIGKLTNSPGIDSRPTGSTFPANGAQREELKARKENQKHGTGSKAGSPTTSTPSGMPNAGLEKKVTSKKKGKQTTKPDSPGPASHSKPMLSDPEKKDPEKDSEQKESEQKESEQKESGQKESEMKESEMKAPERMDRNSFRFGNTPDSKAVASALPGREGSSATPDNKSADLVPKAGRDVTVSAENNGKEHAKPAIAEASSDDELETYPKTTKEPKMAAAAVPTSKGNLRVESQEVDKKRTDVEAVSTSNGKPVPESQSGGGKGTEIATTSIDKPMTNSERAYEAEVTAVPTSVAKITNQHTPVPGKGKEIEEAQEKQLEKAGPVMPKYIAPGLRGALELHVTANGGKEEGNRVAATGSTPRGKNGTTKKEANQTSNIRRLAVKTDFTNGPVPVDCATSGAGTWGRSFAAVMASAKPGGGASEDDKTPVSTGRVFKKSHQSPTTAAAAKNTKASMPPKVEDKAPASSAPIPLPEFSKPLLNWADDDGDDDEFR